MSARHQLYAYIEDFWGDLFDAALLHRIASAKGSVLREFATGWPSTFPETPPVRRGSLRPLINVSTSWERQRAPRDAVASEEISLALYTLLYAPEVLIDRDYLQPFHGLEMRSFGDASLAELRSRDSNLAEKAVEIALNFEESGVRTHQLLVDEMRLSMRELEFLQDLVAQVRQVDASHPPDLQRIYDLHRKLNSFVAPAPRFSREPRTESELKNDYYASYLDVLKHAASFPRDVDLTSRLPADDVRLQRRIDKMHAHIDALVDTMGAASGSTVRAYERLEEQKVSINRSMAVTGSRIRFEEKVRPVIEQRFRILQIIRPFVEQGALVFGAVRPTESQRAIAFETALRLAPELSQEQIDRLPVGVFVGDLSVENRLAAVTTRLEASLELTRTRIATPISRSASESDMWEHIVGGLALDHRVGMVQRLTQVGLPRYRANHDALVRLRQHSDAFAGWRDSLETALTAVEAMPESPEAITDAREVMFDILREKIEAFPIEERRSAVMRSLREGSMTFSLTALIGTGLGVAAGQTATAAALGTATGALSGAAVEGIRAYQQALGQNRRGLLVRDVYLGMYDE